ncbi:MAG: hypothetical protein VB860_04545 [Dehalococcoidia bacterium]
MPKLILNAAYMTDITNNEPGNDASLNDFGDGLGNESANKSGHDSSRRPDQNWLYERTNAAIAADPELVKLRLKPLNKFNTDVTGRAEFIKIYYGISCECSTAAVLSVEASADKTREEFQEALPALLGKLKLQAVGFRRMDCDSHLQMRIQNLPSAR